MEAGKGGKEMEAGRGREEDGGREGRKEDGGREGREGDGGREGGRKNARVCLKICTKFTFCYENKLTQSRKVLQSVLCVQLSWQNHGH